MLNRADFFNTKLQLILDAYTEYFKRDPALLSAQMIAQREVWRLFVDGYRQHLSWLPFEEEEPNYLKALYAAYPLIFSPSENLLDLIMEMHQVALTNVLHTKYEKMTSAIGQVRTSEKPNAIYGLVPENTTRKGLSEYFINRDSKMQYLSIAILGVIDGEKKLIGFLLQDEIIKIIREMTDKLMQAEDKILCIFQAINLSRSPLYETFQALPSDIKEEFVNFMLLLSKTKNNDEIVDAIFATLSNPDHQIKFNFCSKQPDCANTILLNSLQEFISHFNNKVKGAVSPRVKLEAIIALIQQCEQLHPFSDGNCRVFCMLLLNHLLIKHGFPLAILYDPNRFDGFSREELLGEVLFGMEKTFTLLKQKRIYGMSTVQAIALLRSKNKPELLDYFNGLNTALLSNSESRAFSLRFNDA